ncbi:MAG TPA: hypothetical protein VHM26_00280 [Chitinophagaceae bacterium]|jgi:hypothetical protein|nr:hypothetical protein [Chitinophagaceae bacterium]
MKKNKRSLSLIVIASFALFALISCKGGQLTYASFTHSSPDAGGSDSSNYVIKKDGTKIFGKELAHRRTTGVLGSSSAILDGKKYVSPELRGFKLPGEYYGSVKGGGFGRRIIHGKLNVYTIVTAKSMKTGAYGLSSYNYNVTQYFYQRGEDGEIREFKKYSEIKDLVSDCPLAVSMLEKGKKEIKHAIKADNNYLNRVFEIYNNDCKPVK